jgi:hypothetical protein
MEIITFDFIWDCWKNNSYPEDFEDLLEHYIETKNDLFGKINVHEPTSWLSKILIAIEIGILKNSEKFKPYKNYWIKLLGRDYKFSIEDRWIVWKD